ncbi:penicillin-binding transpeptidase domain-containing protein [Caldifermentibacillus hisashii]|uniref:penicillin-binding transpeptidase domain-containing protein n=1 Tax=Caldifermentibacillus hisashii TaxID=996558 RepID=UPI0031B70840
MNHKRILRLLCLFFLIILTGCKSEDAQPSDVFTTYVKYWSNQNFTKMYEMHTPEAKKIMKKDEFVERYKKIYGDLEVKDLKIDFEKPKDKIDPDAKTATIPFKVTMNTLAGPVEFEQKAKLVKVEKEDKVTWQVNWNTGFIFAGMEPEDRVGLKTTKAARGEILDRNGNGLAINGGAYEVGIIPGQMEGKDGEIKSQVASILGISVESIDKALNASWVQPDYFVPIKKIPNTQTDVVTQLENIPAVTVNKVESRVYPLGEAAAHLIGYVDGVTAEDIEKNKGYAPGDIIGKRGLEQLFEKQLKGENGASIYLKKPDGTTATIAEKPVKNGKNIQLTIDSTLQQEIMAKFDGKAGTSVAMNPKTGEMLAMVSSPSFNPNEYMFLSSSQRKTIEENPLQPLLNRFVYPQTPGSVMKPFTAAIGLETNKITADQTRNITSKQWQKDSSWGGYFVTRVTDPGRPVNLKDALVFSDNIYFAQTALDIGADSFIDGLKKFGFDEEIPFTYPVKASQISNDGKLNGDVLLADSGYGQGEVQTNVVHLAAGYTAFINDGNMIKPILVNEEEPSQVWKKSVISTNTVKTIAEDLREVVANPRGTGHLANMDGLPLAGKTGTAEVGKTTQGEQAQENGWFVAYNTDTQDLLVAMMMESIQGEGKIVVNAVKEIFESYKK